MADRSGTSPSTVKHFSGRALIVLLTLIVIKGLKTASRLWVTSCAKVATHLFISDKRATNVWTAVKSALCVHSATTTSPPSPCLRCVRFSSRSAALKLKRSPPGCYHTPLNGPNQSDSFGLRNRFVCTGPGCDCVCECGPRCMRKEPFDRGKRTAMNTRCCRDERSLQKGSWPQLHSDSTWERQRRGEGDCLPTTDNPGNMRADLAQIAAQISPDSSTADWVGQRHLPAATLKQNHSYPMKPP